MLPRLFLCSIFMPRKILLMHWEKDAGQVFTLIRGVFIFKLQVSDLIQYLFYQQVWHARCYIQKSRMALKR
ncbi:MAG: hypothetical protein A2054_02500 [Deltaproteobacteria bacterium GWA2_55_10]|nr:MAG: hypothetical protein A2054_02500 [Deltaproteobacteria bacterium GWA2_55_10]